MTDQAPCKPGRVRAADHSLKPAERPGRRPTRGGGLASVAGVDALVSEILREQFAAWSADGGRPPNAVRAVEEAERRIVAQCGKLLATWALGTLRERYPLKQFPLDAKSEQMLSDAAP
ncbi:hypothetical protein Tasa_013_018 [Tanticharoenia sakaeratensis NBRC 103193]|uniref:Uncharacterized protein n=1 Tax=Tanticharoenia sakaeratensis NBRC 103193 TaxID=1231623 RepID=A0A0D6MJY1_9PROT|nr:hypothetical protein Tasa_013_018 [Tanticharoenia sakaeratensis NBRC 103193]GBQ23581.1 hypothetical protein AA103193_2465 [Tanticharoenia sakaeratensis NBRC 103193]